ncbi:TIGR00296 family protein [Methanobacterium aggregans]|uniref:TIGR00296 family protein n=1 Tax=Methanobacterium aggregans TaxID=1615586 RepID=UPI001AEA6CDB|nr:TIGR00296 family protein [Methanobacterium aggregans]MBP2046874.1 uncharacterized protein (TIGR00296 family) [Methanobacterium aggregans]
MASDEAEKKDKNLLSREDGETLVKIARETIGTYLNEKRILEVPGNIDAKLKEFMGVFVTLQRNGDLRGCIGYPEPVMPLIEGLIDAAISAATRDPRFPPVTPREFEDIQVEVSVLTKPEIIMVENPREYIEKVEVGKDGLIVEMGPYRGLLLPQVAVEWCWNVEEFLANTCMKAGLQADCWLAKDVKIYRFHSQIFNE